MEGAGGGVSDVHEAKRPIAGAAVGLREHDPLTGRRVEGPGIEEIEADRLEDEDSLGGGHRFSMRLSGIEVNGSDLRIFEKARAFAAQRPGKYPYDARAFSNTRSRDLGFPYLLPRLQPWIILGVSLVSFSSFAPLTVRTPPPS